MIRELHVYGAVKSVGAGNGAVAGAQHLGIGKALLAKAEALALKNDCDRIAVISGIGVRDYYRARGYELTGTYMIKQLDKPFPWIALLLVLTILLRIFEKLKF